MLRKINEEVFVAESPIVQFGLEQIEFLKKQAASNDRHRARICAHHSNEDPLHEMLIVISAGSYIHPHRHIGKSESFHIIEGIADVVIFDDAGSIVDVIKLGDVSSGRSFFYRLNASMYHTLLIHSDCLVVHEITNGPFIREETMLAPFAPPETQRDEASVYIERVSHLVSVRSAGGPAL